MKATIKDLTLSRAGGQILTFALDPAEDFTTQFDNLNGKMLDVTIKQYYDKRSLRANRYAWLLSNQLASKMRTSNEEMHLSLLLRYGQTDIIELRKDIDPSRYFEYYRLRNEGELFNEYLVAVGSRHYNTSEMARFIDGIVSECKEQGIPTETPDEIARMVSLWQSQ